MGFFRSGSWAARANEREQAMDGFHRSRNIRARLGRHFRRDGKDYCRWCFADAAVADLFRDKFGGERLVDDGEMAIAESLSAEA